MTHTKFYDRVVSWLCNAKKYEVDVLIAVNNQNIEHTKVPVIAYTKDRAKLMAKEIVEQRVQVKSLGIRSLGKTNLPITKLN